MRNDRENIIVVKTFDFALKVIDFSEIFFAQKRFSLANQIFKSGTSVGANVRESQNAESKADFVHKMKIAAKEADEIEYWLLLCKHSAHLSSPDEQMFHDIRAIQLILSKIIATSKS